MLGLCLNVQHFDVPGEWPRLLPLCANRYDLFLWDENLFRVKCWSCGRNFICFFVPKQVEKGLIIILMHSQRLNSSGQGMSRLQTLVKDGSNVGTSEISSKSQSATVLRIGTHTTSQTLWKGGRHEARQFACPTFLLGCPDRP